MYPGHQLRRHTYRPGQPGPLIQMDAAGQAYVAGPHGPIALHDGDVVITTVDGRFSAVQPNSRPR